MKYLKSVAVAAMVCAGVAGCSDDSASTKTPKLSGDAAAKYDMNAKPAGRTMGGGAGGGAGAPAGGVTKN